MIVFCKSISIYKPGSTKAKAGAEVGARAEVGVRMGLEGQKATKVRIRVPLMAFNGGFQSIFNKFIFAGRRKFQQVYALAK